MIYLFSGYHHPWSTQLLVEFFSSWSSSNRSAFASNWFCIVLAFTFQMMKNLYTTKLNSKYRKYWNSLLPTTLVKNISIDNSLRILSNASALKCGYRCIWPLSLSWCNNQYWLWCNNQYWLWRNNQYWLRCDNQYSILVVIASQPPSWSWRNNHQYWSWRNNQYWLWCDNQYWLWCFNQEHWWCNNQHWRHDADQHGHDVKCCCFECNHQYESELNHAKDYTKNIRISNGPQLWWDGNHKLLNEDK